MEELAVFSSGDVFANHKRVSMNDYIPATFGTSASEATLAQCQPVGFNTTLSTYSAWIAPDPAIAAVDVGDASAGTFTVTVDGQTTGGIAFNATALQAQAALLALGYVVTVDLTGTVYTITFGADVQVAAVPTVTGSTSGLTATTDSVVITAGASSFSTHIVVGFVWPNEVALSATEDTLGNVMVNGRILIDDILATVDVADQTALEDALKSETLSRGLIIEGLDGQH